MSKALILFFFLFTISQQTAAQCIKLSPPPAGVVCETRGFITDRSYPPPLSSADSVDACAALLNNAVPPPRQLKSFSYEGPTFFAYNTTSQICQLYNFSPSYDEFRADNTSDTIISEKDCYKCPLHCPQSGNLLINGDFERDPQLAGPWGGSYIQKEIGGTLASPGFNSATAFYCDQTCSGLVQYYRSCFGQTYSLSYDMKILKVSNLTVTGFERYISSRAGSDFYYDRDFQVPAINNTWVSLEQSFHWQAHSGGTGALAIGVDFDSFDAHFYIDNIQITTLPSPIPTKPGAQEMVVNGGFETQLISPWVAKSSHKRYTSRGVISPGIKSKYAFRWTFRKKFYPGLQIYQTIAVAAGTRYVVRFDCISPDWFPEVTMVIHDGPHDRSVLTYTLSTGLIPNKTYTFERLFKAEYDSIQLSIVFAPGDIRDEPRHSVLLDNVSIKEAA